MVRPGHATECHNVAWSAPTLVRPTFAERSKMRERSPWILDPKTDAEFRKIEQVVSEALAGRHPLRVLEAGCGTQAHVTFGDDAYVVGIDSSALALEQNVDLDERVLGDLGTHPFDSGSFDVVVSVYVLEHVNRPDEVIGRLVDTMAPGGVLALVIPNLRSPKVVVTKYTPHSFHVFVRRRILQRPNAGKPGHGPFPTVLHPAIAPDRLVPLIEGFGLAVLHTAFFEDDKQRQIRDRFRVTGRRWTAVQRAVRTFSGGRLDAERSEFVVVAQRPDRVG